jgi:Rho-binding antiterminator
MIPCEQHDYIELVCTYRYPLKVVLRSGECIECIAQDTQYDQARRECIKVSVAGQDKLIVLEDMASLEVCISNPHVTKLTFA